MQFVYILSLEYSSESTGTISKPFAVYTELPSEAVLTEHVRLGLKSVYPYTDFEIEEIVSELLTSPTGWYTIECFATSSEWLQLHKLQTNTLLV